MQGHTGPVTSLSALRCPASGLLLVSTAADADVRVWHYHHGQHAPACSGPDAAHAGTCGDLAAAEAASCRTSNADGAGDGGHGRRRPVQEHSSAGGAGSGAAAEGVGTESAETLPGGAPAEGSATGRGLAGGDPGGRSAGGDVRAEGGWALRQAVAVGGHMQHAAALTALPGAPGWCVPH